MTEIAGKIKLLSAHGWRWALAAVLLLALYLLVWDYRHADTVFDGQVIAGWQDAQPKTVLFQLRGSWEFYPEQLLEKLSGHAGAAEYIRVPGDWTKSDSLMHPQPADGYGSYRVLIHAPRQPRTYAIATDIIRSSNAVFVNGVKIGSEGTISTTREGSVPWNRPQYYCFTAGGDIEVVIQVANYYFGTAGLISAPYFGDYDAVFRKKTADYIADTIILGSCCAGFVVFGGMLLFQRRWSLAAVAGFCLFAGLFFASINEKLIFSIINGFDASARAWLVNIASPVCVFSAVLYFYHELRNPLLKTHNWANRLIVSSGALVVAIGLVAPMSFNTAHLWAVIAVWLLSMIPVFIRTIKRAELSGLIEVNLLVFGLICFYLAFAIAAVDIVGIANTSYAEALLMPLFVASQILYIARRNYRNELKQSVRASELLYLRAQMNPHFVYNTLTAIAALTKRYPEQARNALVEFSEYLRKMLKDNRELMVASLREDLELADSYVRIESIRFQEQLEVQFEVPEALLGARIPFITIQPLIENCINHGIVAERLLHINVAVTAHKDCLSVVVSDNGSGIPGELIAQIQSRRHSGIGLSGIRDRLSHYNGKLEISSTAAGTTITVELPLRWEKD